MHAFTAGLGLAAASSQLDVSEPLLYSIVSHKATESFSLTTVFLLAGFRSPKIIALGVLFAFMTPAGLLLGNWAMEGVGPDVMAIMIALAAGTFLYVAIGDLLPEVFHNRVDSLARLGLVAAGVGLLIFMHGVGF